MAAANNDAANRIPVRRVCVWGKGEKFDFMGVFTGSALTRKPGLFGRVESNDVVMP